METATAAPAAYAGKDKGAALPQYRTYVSVLPRNARAGDGITIGLAVALAGMTDRHLPGSGILYVFTTLADPDQARAAVEAAIGVHGTTIEALPARYGAQRVTIDPRLIHVA